MRAFLLLPAALLAGCASSTPPFPVPPPTASTQRSTASTQRLAQEPAHGHDHGDHDRGTVMLTDLGKYHAGLTAHLSAKDGNELDILIETQSEPPTAVALPLTSITGTARRGGEEFPLTFEPAPADERKGDAAGTCSHFVAKAAFLKPGDKLTVTVEAEFDGRKRKGVWKGFDVAKYTHAAE